MKTHKYALLGLASGELAMLVNVCSFGFVMACIQVENQLATPCGSGDMGVFISSFMASSNK